MALLDRLITRYRCHCCGSVLFPKAWDTTEKKALWFECPNGCWDERGFSFARLENPLVRLTEAEKFSLNFLLGDKPYSEVCHCKNPSCFVNDKCERDRIPSLGYLGLICKTSCRPLLLRKGIISSCVPGRKCVPIRAPELINGIYVLPSVVKLKLIYHGINVRNLNVGEKLIAFMSFNFANLAPQLAEMLKNRILCILESECSRSNSITSIDLQLSAYRMREAFAMQQAQVSLAV